MAVRVTRPFGNAGSVLPLVALLLLLLPVVGSAAPKGTTYHLELATSSGVDKIGVPLTGSRWLEIYPTASVDFIQTAFVDNGDGELSVGDNIELNGDSFVINWVGPTYHLSCGGQPDRAYQPTALPGTGDPTGTTWSQVRPTFGALQTVQSWQDNGDSIVGPFDTVGISGDTCNVVGALTTVIVEPGTVATFSSDWGVLKALFD